LHLVAFPKIFKLWSPPPTCTGISNNTHPQHMKVLKTLYSYIQYGCGMQSAGVYSLNNETSTSFGLQPFTPNRHHLHRYQGCKGAPLCPSTQHARVLKHFIHPLYTSNMDVGCSQWGFTFTASTMTLHHDKVSAFYLPQFSKL
jgi:hypothetical protein